MDNSRDDQFIERYIECQSGLYRFIATLVPNRADADELFQEASLTAWKIRDRFDPLREMSPWLCGIARNLVAAHYRKQRSRTVTLDPDVVERLGQQQIDEDALLRERARALNACLEKLPDRQRDLVRQYYHSDQTIQTFAQAQGLSAEASYGMDFHGSQTNPQGYRAAFRKDADGRGYTVEYAIPWALLKAQSDPPRAGDTLAATWTVHWSDDSGRRWRGQLVEIRNPAEPLRNNHWDRAASWGQAIYR